MPYTGNSIVDYLRSVGQPTDYASRAQLAASKGIGNYSGSAQQNTQLLNMLRGSAPAAQPTNQPAQAQQPTPQTIIPPVSQPAPQPYQPPAAPSQSAPTSQPQSAQDLVSMGYAGYAGWGDAEAVANFRDTGGQGKGGPTGGGAAGSLSGFISQPTIDLPALYTNLYNSSGVSAKEEELSKNTRAFNDAVSKINDNPFLSEANRVGRIQKLQIDFNNATQAIRDEIATKKADIETQINLQTKQFDINSEQAKQALSQFSVLLDAGALNNATGEDIANITRSTGLSSSIIQSAINAKIQAGYSTETESFDDGVNEGFIVYTIDQMGNVINQSKQVTGKSTKGAKGTGLYSADPLVSSIIQELQQQRSGISDLWEGL